ncbi:PREDICTED: group XIIA secretory phospholipase A2 [Condylura cristata]|uniref:group XIIA secretory phospholipase A2 n=1 Tax=Condylura cristata TaxID=143302 RepID=UPI000642A84A|nr:PREDICTED: group XIIA secretory phospholipase A2 [Condylura cristata]
MAPHAVVRTAPGDLAVSLRSPRRLPQRSQPPKGTEQLSMPDPRVQLREKKAGQRGSGVRGDSPAGVWKVAGGTEEEKTHLFPALAPLQDAWNLPGHEGSKPFARSGYKPSPPNGCGSPLFGVHLNIGIPSLTKCCNQHDRCYETCGKSKSDCDEGFQYCLAKICRDVQKTLGLAQHVQACETTVELLFDSVIHLGCKPYLDSQRAACRCRYEEKTDL